MLVVYFDGIVKLRFIDLLSPSSLNLKKGHGEPGACNET
uniref:Uncharacterized protein n=1 Tax=Arundo donax TaxID=35708 RepID=A0A0A9EE27_ARUDO